MKISPLSEPRKLDKPFAIGGAAEIYDWELGWVLKLYFDCFQPWMADYERGKAAAIYATGLPVPAVGEVVNVDGRKGLLYEKCVGEQMGKDLIKYPWWTVSYALILAELHA